MRSTRIVRDRRRSVGMEILLPGILWILQPRIDETDLILSLIQESKRSNRSVGCLEYIRDRSSSGISAFSVLAAGAPPHSVPFVSILSLRARAEQSVHSVALYITQ